MAGHNGGRPPGFVEANNGSELVRVIKGKVFLTSICSLGGGFIASAYSNFEIDIWNANTGERVKTLTGHRGLVSSLCSLSWPGQSSRFLASGSHDNTVRVWDVITGVCVNTLRDDYMSGVISVCMHSPYDEDDPAYPGILVSGSADKTVRVWNVKEDRCFITFRGHTSNVNSVCSLSSLGEQSDYIASGSSDKTIRIWSLGSREIVTVLDGLAGVILSVCSLGGGLIACGCDDESPYDRTLTIWDTNSGECKNTLTGHDDFVTSVCSLGRNLLASGCNDGKLRIWNIGSGKCVKTLNSRERSVKSVCSLGSEGSNIASSGGYDTIRIWDIYKSSAEVMKQLYRQLPEIPGEIMNHIAGFAGAPLDPHYFGGSTSKSGKVRPGYVDPLTPEARKAILNGPAKADAGNPSSALPSMNELNRKRKSRRRANRRKGTRRQRK